MVHYELFEFLFSSEQLTEMFKSKSGSLEWIDIINSVIQHTHYTKGQVLLSHGQVPDQIFFLLKGSARAYYFDEKGREMTFYLWKENEFVTDIVNYFDKQPSDLCIEICEDASVLILNRIALERVIRDFPESSLFLNGIHLYYTRHHRARDIQYQTLTANKRLERLVKSDTKVELRFTRKWIASFLGMSRSWLYDIKSKKTR